MFWPLKNREQTCCKKNMAADGHHYQLSGSPKDRWTEPAVVWISNSPYIYTYNTFNIT